MMTPTPNQPSPGGGPSCPPLPFLSIASDALRDVRRCKDAADAAEARGDGDAVVRHLGEALRLTNIAAKAVTLHLLAQFTPAGNA